LEASHFIWFLCVTDSSSLALHATFILTLLGNFCL
jgi:hypothetical protein